MAVSGCSCPQVTTLVQSIAGPHASMGQIGIDYAMQLTAHDSCCNRNCVDWPLDFRSNTHTRNHTLAHTHLHIHKRIHTHSASQATWQRLRCQTRLGSFSITTNSLHHNDQKPCTHCRTLYSQRRALAHARTRAHTHTHRHVFSVSSLALCNILRNKAVCRLFCALIATKAMP